MSRWIECEPLMAELDRAERSLINPDEAKGVRLAEFLITEAPSIDIVRCKECRHSNHKYWDGVSFCEYHCGCFRTEVKPDDFCSYGERKSK